MSCMEPSHFLNSTFDRNTFKDLQLVSVTSSFSNFTREEFKQLAYRIHDDFYQGMVSLFEWFNEMQEIHNAFEPQYDILHDHNRRRK